MQRIPLFCGALLLTIAQPAAAQFTQYLAPGALAVTPEDAAERARKQAENARWRLGRVLIQPHLTLSNVSYDRNVFSAPEGTARVNDFRATAGAGLTGYLRFGSKSMASAFVAPEYSAWRKTENLDQTNVNAGVAWFGFFNRLTVTARASNTERERILSRELETPVQISEESASFESVLGLTRRLGLFAIASNSETRHARDIEQFIPNLDLRELDRDSDRQVLGLELRGSDLTVAVGYETTDVDFVSSDARSNSGDGVYVRLSYDRNRLALDATYSDLTIDFEGADLDKTQRAVGQALAAVRLRPETSVSLYAASGLGFSVISSAGVLTFDTQGLSVRQGFGKRLDASVFAERGRERFDDVTTPGRFDDREAVGLSLAWELTERLALTGRLRDETIDSSLDEFDRSTASFGFGVRLGGDLLPW